MPPRWTAVAALLALACAATGTQAVELRRELGAQRLERPLHLTHVPDGSGRLVVVEQRGTVLWFEPGARRAGGTVIDLRDRVSAAHNEEGLLSVAFHPRFAANGLLFAYYSAASPRRSVIARYRADPGTLRADPASGQVVLEVAQPYGNHNGGQLAFGPDGHLYVGLGDGGAAGDPHGNGQDRSTLLGSILRLDVDRTAGDAAYAIPPDNPFAGGEGGARPEIWAYGLRNPWRFSFDRATGSLFAGDVGQNTVEEVDRIDRGGNYGWNRMEGTRCYAPRRDCDGNGLTAPIAEYGRSMGYSVTGGFVYRGRAIPALTGRYVFGDYGSGAVWTIPADARPTVAPEPLLRSDLAISSFGEDAAGELYVVDLRGAVYRLVAGR